MCPQKNGSRIRYGDDGHHACVVAHEAMLEFGGNVLKMSANADRTFCYPMTIGCPRKRRLERLRSPATSSAGFLARFQHGRVRRDQRRGVPCIRTTRRLAERAAHSFLGACSANASGPLALRDQRQGLPLRAAELSLRLLCRRLAAIAPLYPQKRTLADDSWVVSYFRAPCPNLIFRLS